MKTEHKNCLLELWRFVFCMAVLAFHFFIRTEWDFFHAGYLGVEFFFIVSGYFVGVYHEKKQKGKPFLARMKALMNYGGSRLRRLYPLYFLALLLMLFVRMVINRWKMGDVLYNVKSCLAEFFLLQWTPLGNEVLISAGWFVPAVFFGGLFYAALLALTGRFGGYVLSPLISFGIYDYYFHLIGKIDVIFSYHSVLRGVAGIGYGVFIYFLCGCIGRLMEKTERVGQIRRVCMILSSLLFFCLFVYTNFGRRSKWDFLIIALYGMGLILLMSAQVRLGERVEKLFLFLGRTTYPIYALQMPVIELLFFLE